MATVEQIDALVRSHVTRDDDRFRAIVLQIAAHTASKSPKSAERLRKLVDNVAIPLLPMGMQSLLEARPILPSLDDIVLSKSILDIVSKVVRQNARKADLLERGLAPIRRILFTGPPGVGKTMLAGAIARAVSLPMFRVSLHAVIASHMGETAAHLHKVFDTARTVPAVYLFDEFDAISTQRASSDNASADREMHRALNSLLMFFEDFDGPGMLIGATNLASKVDPAMFRRFDQLIEMPPPNEAAVRRMLQAAGIDDTSAPSVYEELRGLGHADLQMAITDVLRDHLIDEVPITTTTLIAAIRRRSRQGD